MTIDEFLNDFAEAAKDENFFLKYNRGIRALKTNIYAKSTNENYLIQTCPITFLCYKKTGHLFTEDNYYSAGDFLGLSRDDTLTVVNCADNPNGQLRNRLLQACGLMEVNHDNRRIY